jgi:hypothetical protein
MSGKRLSVVVTEKKSSLCLSLVAMDTHSQRRCRLESQLDYLKCSTYFRSSAQKQYVPYFWGGSKRIVIALKCWLRFVLETNRYLRRFHQQQWRNAFYQKSAHRINAAVLTNVYAQTQSWVGEFNTSPLSAFGGWESHTEDTFFVAILWWTTGNSTRALCQLLGVKNLIQKTHSFLQYNGEQWNITVPYRRDATSSVPKNYCSI